MSENSPIDHPYTDPVLVEQRLNRLKAMRAACASYAEGLRDLSPNGGQPAALTDLIRDLENHANAFSNGHYPYQAILDKAMEDLWLGHYVLVNSGVGVPMEIAEFLPAFKYFGHHGQVQHISPDIPEDIRAYTRQQAEGQLSWLFNEFMSCVISFMDFIAARTYERFDKLASAALLQEVRLLREELHKQQDLDEQGRILQAHIPLLSNLHLVLKAFDYRVETNQALKLLQACDLFGVQLKEEEIKPELAQEAWSFMENNLQYFVSQFRRTLEQLTQGRKAGGGAGPGL